MANTIISTVDEFEVDNGVVAIGIVLVSDITSTVDEFDVDNGVVAVGIVLVGDKCVGDNLNIDIIVVGDGAFDVDVGVMLNSVCILDG